jgi:IS30 family transposase
MDYEIRGDRRPQGRKKLIRERVAYFQLMEQGYSDKEACRIVGVNPRTGKVWRNDRRSHKGLSKARPRFIGGRLRRAWAVTCASPSVS